MPPLPMPTSGIAEEQPCQSPPENSADQEKPKRACGVRHLVTTSVATTFRVDLHRSCESCLARASVLARSRA
jgi:hypothetical protein